MSKSPGSDSTRTTQRGHNECTRVSKDSHPGPSRHYFTPPNPTPFQPCNNNSAKVHPPSAPPKATLCKDQSEHWICLPYRLADVFMSSDIATGFTTKVFLMAHAHLSHPLLCISQAKAACPPYITASTGFYVRHFVRSKNQFKWCYK